MNNIKDVIYEDFVIEEAMKNNCFAVEIFSKHEERTDIKYMSAFAMNLAVVNNSFIERQLGKLTDVYFNHRYVCQNPKK